MFFHRLCLEIRLFLPLCFYNLIPSAFYLIGNSPKLAKDNSLSGLSTLSWISLPLPPLIHLSYSVLMTSQRRNHLLPHHFSAGAPTFRGVKSAFFMPSQPEHGNSRTRPLVVRSHVETDYSFHLSTQEDLSLIVS